MWFDVDIAEYSQYYMLFTSFSFVRVCLCRFYCRNLCNNRFTFSVQKSSNSDFYSTATFKILMLIIVWIKNVTQLDPKTSREIASSSSIHCISDRKTAEPALPVSSDRPQRHRCLFLVRSFFKSSNRINTHRQVSVSNCCKNRRRQSEDNAGARVRRPLVRVIYWLFISTDYALFVCLFAIGFCTAPSIQVMV